MQLDVDVSPPAFSLIGSGHQTWNLIVMLDKLTYFHKHSHFSVRNTLKIEYGTLKYEFWSSDL